LPAPVHHGPGAPPSRPAPIEHAGYRRFAWGVLAYNVAVVLWGAFVRATGSGAGCGNHWPLCNGQITPHSANLQTIIEFTHRATSGIDLLLVALLVVWGYRAFPKHHPVRLGATLSAVFLITEALIGAALVLLEHVAKNPSTSRGYSLTTHLLNTLTLLACLTLTAWWAGGKPAPRIHGKAAWMAAASVAIVALLGVSGAIAALGDTLFPARSLAEGLSQDLDPAANIFLRLRLIHPVLAAASAIWLLFYAVWAIRYRPDARSYSWAVAACVGAQMIAGLMNLVLLAPVPMQMVHLLLADLLWISLVLLAASTIGSQFELK
jgi:heme A synthase